MKKVKCTLLAICLIVSLILISACDNVETEVQKDKYAGKKCIICGDQATTSLQGTMAMCKSLNPDYTSANYDPGNTSMLYTIYFCDSCNSSIPEYDWQKNKS